MNRSKHPYFVLNNGQYCHILPDRIVIGRQEITEKLPEPKNKHDIVGILFMIIGFCVMTFFSVISFIGMYYVVTVMTGIGVVALFIALLNNWGNSTTKAIYRADIIHVEYKKRMLGFDFFIVHYAGERGKKWKRRLSVYDSQQCLNQALAAMKSEGLLK